MKWYLFQQQADNLTALEHKYKRVRINISYIHSANIKFGPLDSSRFQLTMCNMHFAQHFNQDMELFKTICKNS